MKKHPEREKKIALLQQNLSSIRKIAGWTTGQLGEKIDVSKQTISNLENNKSPMNFTQYIAIRSILDCEIENTENEVLAKVVDILLDRDDELDEEKYAEIQSEIDKVAAAASGGVAGAALAGTFSSLVTPTLIKFGLSSLLGPLAAITGAVVGITGSSWLQKLLQNKNNKES